MPTTRRVSTLLAVLVLALLVPLPQLTGDGSPEYDVSFGATGLAFAEGDEPEIWLSDPVEVDATTVGLSWEDSGAPDGLAWVRSSRDGESWSDWVPMSVDDVHAPDPDTAEARNSRSVSSPVFIGDDRYVQFRVEAEQLPDLEAEFVNTTPKRSGLVERIPLPSLGGAEASPSRPSIVRREQWDSGNKCEPRRDPSTANNVRVMFVHHTVNPNSYSQSQARQIVLNICLYHRNSNGWNDIGYNFLIDQYGTIYEGRAGGIDKGVIGAHTGGYNTGSFGVAFIGTHTSVAPSSSARSALVRLASWKMDRHGINPRGTDKINGKRFNTVSGHRDAGSTACPGNACYNLLGSFRTQIFSRIIGFDDVGNSSHAMNIARIRDAGITKGCTSNLYCPRDFVTRAQMAAFISRAAELKETSNVSFRDVNAFENDINRLATAGITKGCNPPANDRFCPQDYVTRAQMASFIARAKDYTETSNVSFRDVPAGSTHSRAINLLATADVTQGCDNNGNYCPDDFVTREQMASFLARAFLKD